jgi:N,N-dimethylformamidase beta subunit-like, C-terminal
VRPLFAAAAVFALATTLAAGCSTAGNLAAGVARTARATHPAAPAPPFPVAENRKPGTKHWYLHNLGAQDAIEGYTDQVSVLPGQSFRLYVSTTARSFRVQAFRTGWYGGDGARQVWASGTVPGRVQAAPVISAGTRMVSAHWQPSLTISTAGWPEGAYLLRLESSTGQRYVPITVRSATTAGRVVLVMDVTTWQAYNLWGGYSLYSGPTGFADRSYAVSFDRPYDLNGADKFTVFDDPPLTLAEQTGVPLAYETDVDLDRDPGLLAGARAVFSLGHDEYYSAAMRTALLQARDAGTNIAFLGANAMYRHIRFAASALGADRVEICYKDATIDPLYGVHNSETTQNWRDAPDPRPESVLTGVFYECNPVSNAYVVYDPKNWIFAGTGAYKGESFPGLVGPEYDRVNPVAPIPRPLEVLAHSPLTCGGVNSYADSAYYTAASGAGVFASGTMRWVCAMRGRYCGHGVSPAAQRFVDRATTNLLTAFAAGPAGRGHPAHDNLAQLKPRPGAIEGAAD